MFLGDFLKMGLVGGGPVRKGSSNHLLHQWGDLSGSGEIITWRH